MTKSKTRYVMTTAILHRLENSRDPKIHRAYSKCRQVIKEGQRVVSTHARINGIYHEKCYEATIIEA